MKPLLLKSFTIGFFLCIILLISSEVSLGQSGCEIIDFSTTIEVNKNKLIEERSYIIQINKKESDWISDIEIPYQEKDKLDILEASILDLNGQTIRKLKKKEITTRNDISRGAFYQDRWVKEFSLKWNQYPYRIKYTYRKTQNKFLFVAYWLPLVNTNVPVQKASLKVILPKNYDVTINDSNELRHDRNETEENKIHYWESKNMPAILSESYSPPTQTLIPSVKIIPKHFNYGVEGSFESWVSYGQWIEQLNAGLDILTTREKIKIDKLIKGISNKREIVKILYRYLQDNTRYINVAIDIGGLKPYPATYVCENKYGDCKALTIYMKALLKHAGIDSFYTLINAGSNTVKITKKTPSQQFNHVILNVPLGKDSLWLENTASYSPYNYLGTFTQDRYGLMVNGSDTKLVKTKPLKLNDVLVQNIYTFNLDIEGKGNLHVSKKLKGEAFDTYQYVRYELDETEQKQYIEGGLPLSNCEIDTWKFHQEGREDRRLRLSIDLKVENQVRKIGDMIVLRPLAIPYFDLGKPASRKNPVRINYPVNQNDSIIYNLPFTNQFKVEIPENINIESKYGSYTEHFTRSNDQLILIRNFQLNKGNYSLEAYPDLFNFTEKIKKSTKKSVIILNQL
ncbi:DUF3857 domain-containing protein [Ancylomarina sp.]|uniref:DUF3857 domain-containing protein n=1 Tax=Ancylomarina sp. TaxID=1970196 RepID=UPI003566E4A3